MTPPTGSKRGPTMPETTDDARLMDPASHAPRDCDHCRTECLSPADRLAWDDVQLCAACAEAAVQRDEGAAS